MNAAYKKVHDIASSAWTGLIATTCTLVTFIHFVYTATFSKSSAFWPAIVFFVMLAIFILVHFYTSSLRRKHKEISSIFRHLHEINHCYRNTLRDAFSSHDFVSEKPEDSKDSARSKTCSEEKLLDIERRAIESTCKKIEKIYSTIINKNCMVTVKLMTSTTDKETACETYARSDSDTQRDCTSPMQYLVGTGLNTAFDEALRIRPGICRHFFSPDLVKDHKQDKYHNQRPGWEKCYKSTLVVPISSGGNNNVDDLGYLCVDTLTRNRLKDGFHLFLLAALADQMYNFFSLMRGTYQFLGSKTEAQR